MKVNDQVVLTPIEKCLELCEELLENNEEMKTIINQYYNV